MVEVLVSELFAINRLATRAIATSKVASLNHEILDDAMEGATLKVQTFAASSHSLLTSAKGSKTHHPPQKIHLKFSDVFGVSYNSITLQNAYLVQLHHNSSS